METGNATLNQKVFVTLAGYTRLVNEYHRTLNEVEKRSNQVVGGDKILWTGRRDALEFVFRTLEFPIYK